MGVQPVTFYEVVCDEPKCGVRSSDMDCEFAAWSDADQALDSWRDFDGFTSEDGKTFCVDHRPEFCVDCDIDDQVVATGHTADGQPACDEHRQPDEADIAEERLKARDYDAWAAL